MLDSKNTSRAEWIRRQRGADALLLSDEKEAATPGRKGGGGGPPTFSTPMQIRETRKRPPVIEPLCSSNRPFLLPPHQPPLPSPRRGVDDAPKRGVLKEGAAVVPEFVPRHPFPSPVPVSSLTISIPTSSLRLEPTHQNGSLGLRRGEGKVRLGKDGGTKRRGEAVDGVKREDRGAHKEGEQKISHQGNALHKP